MDTSTGKRTSLQTGSEDEAQQIIQAKNQAERQPVLNLQIAKAYLAGTDSGVSQAHLAAGPGRLDSQQTRSEPGALAGALGSGQGV